MRTANLDDITTGSRQRKLFESGAIDDLAESIATSSLLHPIVCSKDDQGGLHLVAGERRVRAVRELAQAGRTFDCDGMAIAPGEIPYILITDRTDLELREAELQENIIREALTWQERVIALDELHRLRQEQNPKQNVSATAREIQSPMLAFSTARRDITNALIIAPHLDDPEVARARNAKEAFNIVTRKMEAEMVAELNRRGSSRKSQHTLIQGDMTNILPTLDEGQFDCIIADPPYGMGAQSFGGAAKLAHTYADTPEIACRVAECIATEGFRLCKSEAHLYLFCDIEHFTALRDMFAAAGWVSWRTPLIWCKGTMGHAPKSVLGWRRSYELLLFASKGNKPFVTLYSDTIQMPNLRDRVHAAQKPIELYKILMKRSCLPGDAVLDPCCGSGTVFRAATEANLRATGVELDEETTKQAMVAIEADGRRT